MRLPEPVGRARLRLSTYKAKYTAESR